MPDERESRLGLAICVFGGVAGMALSWFEFGWMPVYVLGLVAVAIAAVLPARFRPWALFVAVVPVILWGVGVVFIALFAGGSLLHLLNFPIAAFFVAGTIVVFDAAW
jgi:hypothetical protein